MAIVSDKCPSFPKRNTDTGRCGSSIKGTVGQAFRRETVMFDSAAKLKNDSAQIKGFQCESRPRRSARSGESILPHRWQSSPDASPNSRSFLTTGPSFVG